MFKLDDNLLIELGLGTLPPAEKNRMLGHIYETLEMRVGMKLAQKMTNEQLDEFEKKNRDVKFSSVKLADTQIKSLKEKIIEKDLINHSVGSFDKTQSILIKTDNTTKVDDTDYMVSKKHLFKTKLYYAEMVVYLWFIFFMFVIYTTGMIIISTSYDRLQNYHQQDDLFLKKFTLFGELILLYQISFIKKEEIRKDNTTYFDSIKNEYFYYFDQIKKIKQNDQFEVDNLQDIENHLEGSDFCSSLTNYTGNSIPNCSNMLGGINTKGYSVMLSTIYNNIFFLYDDLLSKFRNDEPIDIIQINYLLFT